MNKQKRSPIDMIIKRCIILLFATVLWSACLNKQKRGERVLSYYLRQQTQAVYEMNKEVNEATWQSFASAGSLDSIHSACSHLQHKGRSMSAFGSTFNQLHSDRSDLEFIRVMQQSGMVKNDQLKRQLDKLMGMYQNSQYGFDSLEFKKNLLLQAYYDILSFEMDHPNLRTNTSLFQNYQSRIFDLQLQFSATIQECNQVAQKAGYENYFNYLCRINELDSQRRKLLVEQVDQVTRTDYLKLQNYATQQLTKQFKIPPDKLTLSHYNYFYGSLRHPAHWKQTYSTDSLLSDLTAFFQEVGFGLEEVVSNSVFENDSSKLQHTLGINIDGYYDMRIYSNRKPNFCGLLNYTHELGQACSYMAIEPEVPFLLREPNPVIHESVGIYFENLVFKSTYLQNKLKLKQVNKGSKLPFDNPWFLFLIRNLLVMAEVEREMFVNPEQNLSTLFWEKVEQYLFLNVPDDQKHDEWLKKNQLLSLNGTYQYYLYACVLAAQYYHCQLEDEAFYSHLKTKLLSSGNTHRWDSLVVNLCGEALTPGYLVDFY
jgi:peptidyl-dipeptidase A